MPVWTVEPGKKTTEPDNPDCGDATEEDIVPGEADSWEVSNGGSVVSVSPLSGSGDANFTVTALNEGCTSLAVTWKYTLTMNENCPKDFSEPGPTVNVCVIDPNNPPTTTRRRAVSRSTAGGGCSVTKEKFVNGMGLTFPPKIRITVTCIERCAAGTGCNLYSPDVTVEMIKPGKIKVGTKRRTTSWPPEECDRTQDAIDRTIAHEQIHCQLFEDAFTKLKQDFEAENGKRPSTPCPGCEAAARVLLEAVKAAWEAAVDAASSHGNPDIQGTTRECRFMDDNNPCATEDCASNPAHPAGTPPCQYDNTDIGGGLPGFPDVWSQPTINQTPCFEIIQESEER